MFSWTKRLVRQVVQRILDTVLWPSPVTALWEAGQQNLCQTWGRTFSAPWDKMVVKCPPQSHGQVYEQKEALPTGDWHLPSTSMEIISWPLQLLTFNGPERSSGWRSRMRHSMLWEKLAKQAFRELDLFKIFYESQFLHLLIPRETLTSLMVPSALAIKKFLQLKVKIEYSAMVQTSWEINRCYYGCNFRLDIVLLNTWVFCVVSGLDATILKTMSAGSQ